MALVRRTLQASLVVRAAGDPSSALYLGRPWTEARLLELAFRDPNHDHAGLQALHQGRGGALARLLKRPRDLRPGPVRDLLENQEVQELCRLDSEASHGKLRQNGRDWRLGLSDHLTTLTQDLAPDARPPVWMSCWCCYRWARPCSGSSGAGARKDRPRRR